LETNQLLNKNQWKNIENNHQSYISRKDLNKDETKEYDIIKSLSGQLVYVNFKRYPAFHRIQKTVNGYYVSRRCNSKNNCCCFWAININIKTNEAKLSCKKNCPHLTKSTEFKFFYIYKYML
jgi:ribosomal protein L33